MVDFIDSSELPMKFYRMSTTALHHQVKLYGAPLLWTIHYQRDKKSVQIKLELLCDMLLLGRSRINILYCYGNISSFLLDLEFSYGKSIVTLTSAGRPEEDVISLL
jgi:hypothetical protein